MRDALDALSLGPDGSFYGPIEFTGDGDGDAGETGPVLQQLLDGRLEVVYPDSARTADCVYPAPRPERALT